MTSSTLSISNLVLENLFAVTSFMDERDSLKLAQRIDREIAIKNVFSNNSASMIEMIEKTLKLNEMISLRQNRDSFLCFDENWCPYLAENAISDNSFWDKYRFYSGEIYRKAQTLFQNYFEIIEDLFSKKFEGESCLQNLKNTYTVITLIDQAVDNLANACEFSKNIKIKLSFWEEVVFRIIYFVCYFFSKRVPGAPLRNLAPIFCRTKTAEFGRSLIVFKGKTIPVKIEACYTPELGISFSIKSDGEPLGKMVISRNSRSTLLRCSILHDELQQDDVNGDRPISRLLVQIAVEIFNRDRASELEVRTSSSEIFVLGALGFCCGNELDKKIQRVLIDAHAENKIFPSTDSVSSHLSIYKKVNFCGSDTKFFNKFGEDKKENAVIVRLLHDAQTWEEIITKRPLLGNGEEPVLPYNSAEDFLDESQGRIDYSFWR